MLKITRSDYEIKEPIELVKNVDGKEEVLYQFDMKLTEDDVLKLKDLLFGKDDDKDVKIADICFKGDNEKFKEIAGEYKYNETLEEVKAYLLDFFIKKQISPLNTTITDLTKIMNSYQKFK